MNSWFNTKYLHKTVQFTNANEKSPIKKVFSLVSTTDQRLNNSSAQIVSIFHEFSSNFFCSMCKICWWFPQSDFKLTQHSSPHLGGFSSCCMKLHSRQPGLCWLLIFSPHCAAWLGASGGAELGRSQAEPAAPSSAPWLGGAAGQPGKNLLRQSWAQNHTVATTHSAVRLFSSLQKTY